MLGRLYSFLKSLINHGNFVAEEFLPAEGGGIGGEEEVHEGSRADEDVGDVILVEGFLPAGLVL